MYHILLHRQRDLVAQCVRLLSENSRDMALDPRFYHHIGNTSGSSVCSTGSSVVTGITVPSCASSTASAAALRSTASSPSLRAREGVVVPVGRQDGISSPTPGGNVRVVVRVRKFLPRGMFFLPALQGIEKKGIDCVLSFLNRDREKCRVPHFHGPPYASDQA